MIPSEPELDPARAVDDVVDAASAERWGLTEHAAKLPHMLSRGTATKVQHAQAFWAGPDKLSL